MIDQSRTITLDGVSHEVAQFSEGVQQAIHIYNTFVADLEKSQLETVKCQAAMQTVGNQISAAVKRELEEKAAAAVAASDAIAAEQPSAG